MKAVIKVKCWIPECKPTVTENGDWIDLHAMSMNMDHRFGLINLGVAMKLPDGYEAILASRSSTYKNWNIIMQGGIGVIDNSYCGDNDMWRFPYLRIGGVKQMNVGDRICQFKIQLSQKATLWQRIKWLFTTGVKLEFVDHLEGKDRGGIGSTGK